MTCARNQPFCRKCNINIGCFNGKETTLRNIIERKKALKTRKNFFCSIWKPEGVSFNKAIEDELKPNF